ncbi:MAG: nitroreductase/quinone reductase family protein [Anaerolineales bacterium]
MQPSIFAQFSHEIWVTAHHRDKIMAFKRWEYRGGRPNLIAKIQNRGWAFLHASGLLPDRFVTLEVAGRKSGKIIRFPLAMVVIDGNRYLVSMLGEEANWVKNVRAAEGKASLVHGVREEVQLEEVDPDQRAPILKAYLHIAPGARPHIPVSKDASLAEFEKIAADLPVFRIKTQKPGKNN